MADHSTIEWTDATWQIVTGCSIVSPGCSSCYAMRLAGTRLKHHPSRAGLTKPSKAGPVWTGEVRFNADWLRQPLQWRDPRMIFVAAHGDLFHEDVALHHLDDIFAVMALALQHTFQVLTKRPERAAKYTNGLLTTSFPTDHIERAMKNISPGHKIKLEWPLPNVWTGTSVEDQVRAAERLSHLRDVRTAIRWVSFEPLLGAVNARDIDLPYERFDALAGKRHFTTGEVRDTGRIHWAVIGGESGPRARLMEEAWASGLVEQCRTTGVSVFVKQLSGPKGRAIKDVSAFPAALQFREFPHAA